MSGSDAEPDLRAARLDACLAISALCLELAEAGRLRREAAAETVAPEPSIGDDSP